MLKIIALTAIAMLAFAANSVLARLALAMPNADAIGYTGVRMSAGAVTLAAIMLAHTRWTSDANTGFGGSWRAAAALFGYAICFSLAYVRISTGTGALILFAAVQFSMLGWAILKGDRLGALEWLGLALAVCAFVYLVSPGLAAPSPAGAALMVASGMSWAVYTLLGRGSQSPLADTAGNFVRCLPVAAVMTIAAHVKQPLISDAVVYAVLSGALASGVGYALWYAVLPSLSRTRAAVVQLTVPAIAALGGVALIGEPLTLRLVIASIGILGGVAIALTTAGQNKSKA